MSDAQREFLNRQAQQGEEKGAPAQGESPAQAEGVASPEVSQEESAIPYTRFKQVNDQKKQIAAELEASRAEMAALQERLEKAEAERRQREYSEKLEGISDEAKQALFEMQRAQEERLAPRPDPNRDLVARQATEWQLFKETSHQFSDEQVDVVMQVKAENPKLRDATELLFLAQRRDPSLFQGWEVQGGSPHFVQPTGQGREDQGMAKRIDELQAEMRSTNDPIRQQELAVELIRARRQGSI